MTTISKPVIVIERIVILNESSKIVPGCSDAVHITLGGLVKAVGKVTATTFKTSVLVTLPTSTLPHCIAVKEANVVPVGPVAPVGPVKP